MQARIDGYCSRYDASRGTQGLPPYPSGQRETVQHREWMALYKAHRRIAGRSHASPEGRERVLDLLLAQRSRCAICRKPLEVADTRLDPVSSRPGSDLGPALLHARCQEFLGLARALGVDALDRAKARL